MACFCRKWTWRAWSNTRYWFQRKNNWPKLSGKGSFNALNGMALRWKGPFLGSPKKAITYHLFEIIGK
jgi:hypothetical protein